MNLYYPSVAAHGITRIIVIVITVECVKVEQIGLYYVRQILNIHHFIHVCSDLFMYITSRRSLFRNLGSLGKILGSLKQTIDQHRHNDKNDRVRFTKTAVSLMFINSRGQVSTNLPYIHIRTIITFRLINILKTKKIQNKIERSCQPACHF